MKVWLESTNALGNVKEEHCEKLKKNGFIITKGQSKDLPGHVGVKFCQASVEISTIIDILKIMKILDCPVYIEDGIDPGCYPNMTIVDGWL